jgi:ABC-type antimicrobial peptide transport system permease subunit
MNLIISVFIGIIVGLLHSMVEKKSKLELENSITNNNVQKRFSFYEIFIQYIIPNILKLSFVSGLIGIIYGILASIIMSKMI